MPRAEIPDEYMETWHLAGEEVRASGNPLFLDLPHPDEEALKKEELKEDGIVLDDTPENRIRCAISDFKFIMALLMFDASGTTPIDWLKYWEAPELPVHHLR